MEVARKVPILENGVVVFGRCHVDGDVVRFTVREYGNERRDIKEVGW